MTTNFKTPTCTVCGVPLNAEERSECFDRVLEPRCYMHQAEFIEEGSR